MDIAAARTYILERLSRELAPDLYYHGVHHTLDVVQSALNLAQLEGVTDSYDLCMLETAALYHDSGFLITCEGHEEAGGEIVCEVLPRFGYDSQQVTAIRSMILATRIPQTPCTKLEEILCDADLDYLGRNDFEPIAEKLFEELKARGLVKDVQRWNRMQIRFLEQHCYWTASAKALREGGKREHLESLRGVVLSQTS